MSFKPQLYFLPNQLLTLQQIKSITLPLSQNTIHLYSLFVNGGVRRGQTFDDYEKFLPETNFSPFDATR